MMSWEINSKKLFEFNLTDLFFVVIVACLPCNCCLLLLVCGITDIVSKVAVGQGFIVCFPVDRMSGANERQFRLFVKARKRYGVHIG